ncbi:MAG: ImmA/IrrE family metallo-endopeptidase [Desulfomonilaceae bacterium]
MENIGKFIAGNIKRLRLIREINQIQLAEAAGISRAAFQKIEAGAVVPRLSTLQKISTALQVEIDDLVTQIPQLTKVRFRSNSELKSRDEVLFKVGRWLKDYSALGAMLPESRLEYQLKDVPTKITSTVNKRGESERGKIAAQIVRRRLSINDDTPIVDIGLVLERSGIKVLRYPGGTEGFFGLSVADENYGGPAVIVNVGRRIPVERWIFTAAHELGHLMLHLNSFDVNETNEDSGQEAEADNFAAQFLMPEQAFGEYLKLSRGLDFVDWVLKVKRVFLVSYLTVLKRLKTMGLADDTIYDVFRDRYHKKYKRRLKRTEEPEGISAGNFGIGAEHKDVSLIEPDKLDPYDFLEDRLCGLVREAFEKNLITAGKAAKILGLSIGEMQGLIGSWRLFSDRGGR